jgi:hypothetical protein
MELVSSIWRLKISVSTYYSSTDLVTWEAVAGGLPEPVGTLGTLATMNLGVGGSGWGFSGDGDLTLPEGSTISETNTTTVITPPGALAGQSLVIRPTSAFGLTASGYIVAGTNLTITLTNISSITSLQFNYTITGATAQQLGVGSLTGSFPVLSPGTSPQSSSIVLPIPGNSNATTFTLTIDSDQSLGAANTTITVTDNGVTNSETSHIHLMSGNPTTTDIYLGDDDQYVKIEKNAGNVVIGTNTNTNHWTFGTDSKLSIPNDASIRSIDNQASAIIATNVTWDSNDPYTPGRFGSAVFDGNADFTNLDATILNIIDGANKTFTIEGWILRDLTGHAPNYYGEFIIGDIGGASGTDVEWSVSIAEHGKLIFVVNGNGGSAAALGDTIMLEQAWYHFAVVVNNGAIKLFVGGVLQSITGDSTITHWPSNHFTPHSLRIGQWYDIYHSFYGNMSGLRVVQGTAVYTSTFTPSVTPLSYIQGTTLLLLFKNDTSLTENTVNNGLELTRGGNSWTFGTDRLLTLPSIISGYEATIGPVLDVGTVLQAQESLWVASTLDVKIQVNNDVAGQKTWEFWTNGITFPDTTLQSTAFQDIPSHIYFVHPNPGPRVYTETGTYNSPFKTINAAVNAAMTAGHQDSDPATIILMASITENITLKPGIYLTSLGTGTHGSPNITGTITVNSTTGGLVANHYSISNLRIIAPSDITNCINFTGTAPQRLFLRDMWLDARGTSTCITMTNNDTTSTLQMDTAHLAHSGTGDIYCIDVSYGKCYLTDIETSGNVQVAAVRAGTTMTINGSELDGNNTATIQVYGGVLTVTNSIITNAQSNSSGIRLNTTGSVLTLGNCVMTIPAGSGKAVYGVATTYMYYANVFFTPGSNTSKTASPELISALLSSTWT